MGNTITWSSAGPSVEPLTLADVQNFLRIDSQANDDDWLTALITAARTACEKHTNLLLLTQTVTQTQDQWTSWNTINIEKGPIQSVTSVTVYDDTGTPTVIDSSTYSVDPVGQRIVMKNGDHLPQIGQNVMGAVTVYQAGFGDAATDVPQNLIQGMRAWIAFMYENRDQPIDVPPAICAAWNSQKRIFI